MNTNSMIPPDLNPSVQILTKLDAESINQFLKVTGDYVKKYKSVSVTNLVDENILEALMSGGYFSEAKSVEDIKDESLWKILEEKASNVLICTNYKKMTVKMRKKVEINMDEKNIDLRMLSLFTDYHRFMMSIGKNNIIHENPKLAGRHIYMLLQPQKVKEEVQKIVEVEDFAQDKGFEWYRFYRQVRDIAFQQDVEFFFTEEVALSDSVQIVEKYKKLNLNELT